MRATDWAGSGSAGYINGTIVVLSLISLSTVWFGYAWAKRVSGTPAAMIAAGACSIYFGLVYFAPKALYEVVATHLLLPGLYLGVYGDRIGEKKRMFFAGLLCGLAASLRIQLIPAVTFAAVYFCYPRWRQRIPIMFAGLSLPLLAFGLVDWFTWTYPWQSFIRYFQVNLMEGRSLIYGVEPWYWYLRILLTLLGPAVLFLWTGAQRSPFLAIFSLIILCSHLPIAHKELRFIYPILPLALTLASIGIVEFSSGMRSLTASAAYPKATVAIGLIFFILSSSLLVIRQSKYWCQMRWGDFAFDRLSRDSRLCGVGLYQAPWWQSGGYAHLHRNVPIVQVLDADELIKDVPTFNAIITPVATSAMPFGFKQTGCWNGVCLLQRAGTCTTPPTDDELNSYLKKGGY